MDVDELKGRIPNEIFESLKLRIKELTPPQELAIKKGLLEGKNLVVSSPTASGKTVIAEIALLTSIIKHEKKAVYIAPMRALVREKYEEFMKNYPYIKSAISIGGYDSDDPHLQNFDLIFVSTEKMDSLVRHGVRWIDKIGCIVFDEVHMLNDFSRGPTLEVLITKLLEINPKMQIIFLSATIGNAKELAEWLNAEVVESSYRPVKLHKGVVYKDKIHFIDGNKVDIDFGKDAEENVVEYVLKNNKQAIFFYSSKRNAESAAKEFKKLVEKILKNDEKEKLKKISEKVLKVLDNPTKQCKELSETIKSGVAFHHAGLLNQQRVEVERAFKEGLVKIICSTTTLGLGVNLPANTVVVSNLGRYDEENGYISLGPNEITQLLGRAGRPNYDSYGVALLLSKNKERIYELFELLNAPPEPIHSKLGYEPTLRMHVLSLICSGYSNKNKILDFFKRTFFGFEYGDLEDIKIQINRIVENFKRWGFVLEARDLLFPTKEGRRVNELYIDPLSAYLILKSISKTNGRGELPILLGAVNTIELKPFVKLKNEEEAFKEYAELKEYIDDEYLIDDPLKVISTYMMFRDWIEEMEEDKLLEKYSITPGNFFGKLNNLDWILYAYAELLKLKKMSFRDALKLRIRINYGIKEELMELVSLEGIGRARARKLFKMDIKSIKDLREALKYENRKGEIEKAIGKEVTKSIEKQLFSLDNGNFANDL